MSFAQLTTPSLLGLTFLAGFGCATLLFVLLFRRDKRASPAARVPKHALGTPALVAAPERASSTAVESAAQTIPTEPVESAQPTERPDQDPTEPDALDADFPELPTDLFEQRYEAKFERTRKRLERLRTQLNENEEIATRN